MTFNKTTLYLQTTSVLLIASLYIPWISFIALIGLLFCLEDDRRPVKKTFIAFFPFTLFIYSGIFKSVYIFYGLPILIAVLIYLFLCFYHLFYFILPVVIYKKTRMNILFLPFLFVSFEYLRNVIFYGLPIGNLSALVVQLKPFVRDASILGAYFISLKIVFVNIGIYLMLKKHLSGVFILAIIVLLLFIPQQNRPPAIKTTKTVSIVQANIPQNEKWIPKYLSRNLQTYMYLSSNLKSDIVLWPESAYPYLFSKNDSIIPNFMKNRSYKLIFGAVRQVGNYYYNSAVCSDQSGVLDIYNKQKLVPFAEFIPIRNILAHFIPARMDPGDFQAGRKDKIFRLDKLNIGNMICYEENFSYIAKTYKMLKADAIVELTNDAWFDHTPTFYLLSRDSILRAIENNIWVFRVANTGISEIVSPKGRIVALLKPYTRGVLTKKIEFSYEKPTIFDRWGHFFPTFLLFFTVIAVILTIFYKRDKKLK